jgi:uncharacterized membrane protein YpjA
MEHFGLAIKALFSSNLMIKCLISIKMFFSVFFLNTYVDYQFIAIYRTIDQLKYSTEQLATPPAF